MSADLQLLPARRELRFEMSAQGEPVSKGRPRTWTTSRGRVVTFTPTQTRAAERALALQARLQRKAPMAGSELEVELDFVCSTRRRRDIDNLAKLVLDALNGVVWADDAQITVLRMTKTVDPGEARTVVRVYERV